MRYRLDDLGWFHFEKLVQSLLKAHLGLQVESWGGSQSDLGRDAYCQYVLAFPDPKEKRDGPFVFQVKFVQNANAAGADWWPALSRAVGAEARALRKRIGMAGCREPAHYVLVTNAPLNVAARQHVEAAIRGVILGASVTSLGGSDVCDLMDQNPDIRRSFPEVLGLRDLDFLLSEVVNPAYWSAVVVPLRRPGT